MSDASPCAISIHYNWIQLIWVHVIGWYIVIVCYCVILPGEGFCRGYCSLCIVLYVNVKSRNHKKLGEIIWNHTLLENAWNEQKPAPLLARWWTGPEFFETPEKVCKKRSSDLVWDALEQHSLRGDFLLSEERQNFRPDFENPSTPKRRSSRSRGLYMLVCACVFAFYFSIFYCVFSCFFHYRSLPIIFFQLLSFSSKINIHGNQSHTHCDPKRCRWNILKYNYYNIL